MASLERVIEIAVLAHKGTSDKSGAPYVIHPLRLMFALEDAETKIVAVLAVKQQALCTEGREVSMLNDCCVNQNILH